MLNPSHKKRQKAFTLVELMIVIAVIGILAAIAIPQFIRYRINGFNKSAKADINQMYVASQAFFTENKDGSVDIADLRAYGYNQTNNVIATAEGTISTLLITAIHAQGTITYSENSTGVITPN